jgi:hypothetical protein
MVRNSSSSGNALAPGVPVGADGQAADDAGRQPVAHRVEDRERQHLAVQRVVEAVAADLVRRLEQAGDGRAAGGEREGRQQGPLHLGGEVQIGAATLQVVAVGVGGGRHDEQRGEQAELLGELAALLVQVVDRQCEDAEPLGALGHGHPQQHGAVVGAGFQQRLRREAPAGHGAGHGRGQHGSARARAGPGWAAGPAARSR